MQGKYKVRIENNISAQRACMQDELARIVIVKPRSSLCAKKMGLRVLWWQCHKDKCHKVGQVFTATVDVDFSGN